jgi:hypothetical protein
MQYHLRTLLIVLALEWPMLAGGWWLPGSHLLADESVQITDESYWVVSDAYFLNKPRRRQVGMTMVFWKGSLFWVSKDGSRSDVQQLTPMRSDEGTRFSCKSERTGIGGKGLIVHKGDDEIWVYLSVNDKDYDAILPPGAGIDKAESAYRCLRLEKDDALKQLALADLELK